MLFLKDHMFLTHHVKFVDLRLSSRDLRYELAPSILKQHGLLLHQLEYRQGDQLYHHQIVELRRRLSSMLIGAFDHSEYHQKQQEQFYVMKPNPCQRRYLEEG